MIKLPPKNRNQSIYWTQLCVDLNRPRPPSKQTVYRQNLQDTRQLLLGCMSIPQVPAVVEEINRILTLKTVTTKHLDKISNWIDEIHRINYG